MQTGNGKQGDDHGFTIKACVDGLERELHLTGNEFITLISNTGTFFKTLTYLWELAHTAQELSKQGFKHERK